MRVLAFALVVLACGPAMPAPVAHNQPAPEPAPDPAPPPTTTEEPPAPPPMGHFRFVGAQRHAGDVQVSIDGQVVVPALAYGAVSDWIDVTPGEHEILTPPEAGSTRTGGALVTRYSIAEGQWQMVLVRAIANSAITVEYDRGQAAPDGARATLFYATDVGNVTLCLEDNGTQRMLSPQLSEGQTDEPFDLPVVGNPVLLLRQYHARPDCEGAVLFPLRIAPTAGTGYEIVVVGSLRDNRAFELLACPRPPAESTECTRTPLTPPVRR